MPDIETCFLPFGAYEASDVAVVGAAGTDRFVASGRLVDIIEPDGKLPLDSPEQITIIAKNNEIDMTEAMVASGQTAANVAKGIAKTGEHVLLFTSLAPYEEDPTTGTILDDLRMEGIDVRVSDAPGTKNPTSLVILSNGSQQTAVYKPTDAPEIVMKPQRENPGVVVLCSAGGPWNKTWDNAEGYAQDTDAPTFIIASESQILQLKDQNKKEAYLRSLRNAKGFSGNVREAELLVEFNGGRPAKGDPVRLAHQIRYIGEEKALVTLTNGKDGGVTLDGVGNIYTHHVPEEAKGRWLRKKLGITWLGDRVSTLGAGDQHGAILLSGVRRWGASMDGIERSTRMAGVGSSNVITAVDAQSRQLTRLQFLGKPHRSVSVEVTPSRSWNFPAPAPALSVRRP